MWHTLWQQPRTRVHTSDFLHRATLWHDPLPARSTKHQGRFSIGESPLTTHGHSPSAGAAAHLGSGSTQSRRLAHECQRWQRYRHPGPRRNTTTAATNVNTGKPMHQRKRYTTPALHTHPPSNTRTRTATTTHNNHPQSIESHTTRANRCGDYTRDTANSHTRCRGWVGPRTRPSPSSRPWSTSAPSGP